MKNHTKNHKRLTLERQSIRSLAALDLVTVAAAGGGVDVKPDSFGVPSCPLSCAVACR